jgi:excisionase family DNA binding protein
VARTTKQVAKKLGVTPRTVRNRIKAGKIRAAKPGHDYIITGSSSGSKKKGSTKKKSTAKKRSTSGRKRSSKSRGRKR